MLTFKAPVKNVSENTRPRSTVGNVSDCGSRGLEFDPGSVPNFVKINHEIISTAILHPSTDSRRVFVSNSQLQVKVCAQSTG